MTDTEAGYSVVSSTEIYRGKIMALHLDSVRMSDGRVAKREIVIHPGAVGVVALDESEPQPRVVMVNQYRHPVGRRLTELPAGLLDVEGESALLAARRELAEETALIADEWHVLLDLYTSPGLSSEAIRIYLARGLHPVPTEDLFSPEDEEITMTVDRVPLTDLVAAALAGDLTNGIAVAGVLAAARVVELGLDGAGLASLRPADAPWPARPGR